MLPYINRKLPNFIKESFYWKVSKKFNNYYKKSYEKIKIDLIKNLFIKGIFTDTISQQLLFQGYYDLPLSKLILKIAKNNGVFIDVGANIGYHSLLFAKANQQTEVHSFEPSKRNLDLLHHNVKMNDLTNQVKVYPYAVSNKDGEMYFDNSSIDQTGWGHLTKEITDHKVKVIQLDTYFLDIGKPVDLLKIDVEGFDLNVIMGAKQMLERGLIKCIVFEYHKNLFQLKEFELNELEKDFFKIISFSGYILKKFSAHDYILTKN